jgi:acetolactate synthase-1/2/3 large subunit
MPLDIGGMVAGRARIHAGNVEQTWTVDQHASALLAREMSRAKRPLLILGCGARGAMAQTVAFAERLALPVVVTGHGKGAFPERHPQYLGIIGIGQHPSVDEYLLEPPDVTLVVGAGLDDLATNGWSLPLIGTRTSFQIDRRPSALGRGLCSSNLIVGDAATVLDSALRQLPSDVARPQRRGPRVARLRPETAVSDAVPLKPARVLSALAKAFPDATWCSDIGEHLAYALHYVEVDSPDKFHNFLGFGSMGSGVGAAIGMQLAWRDRQVVCVCGDGGFSMMLGELLTCVEQRLGVVFAVMNDGMWNMVEHGFRTVYGATPGGFVHALADFDAVGAAVGAVGVRVTTAADLDPDLLRAWTRAGLPVVLDVRIDATEALSPGTRAASISHFCADAS